MASLSRLLRESFTRLFLRAYAHKPFLTFFTIYDCLTCTNRNGKPKCPTCTKQTEFCWQLQVRQSLTEMVVPAVVGSPLSHVRLGSSRSWPQHYGPLPSAHHSTLCGRLAVSSPHYDASGLYVQTHVHIATTRFRLIFTHTSTCMCTHTSKDSFHTHKYMYIHVHTQAKTE